MQEAETVAAVAMEEMEHAEETVCLVWMLQGILLVLMEDLVVQEEMAEMPLMELMEEQEDLFRS